MTSTWRVQYYSSDTSVFFIQYPYLSLCCLFLSIDNKNSNVTTLQDALDLYKQQCRIKAVTSHHSWLFHDILGDMAAQLFVPQRQTGLVKLIISGRTILYSAFYGRCLRLINSSKFRVEVVSGFHVKTGIKPEISLLCNNSSSSKLPSPSFIIQERNESAHTVYKSVSAGFKLFQPTSQFCLVLSELLTKNYEW